jgi:hypothetical protein
MFSISFLVFTFFYFVLFISHTFLAYFAHFEKIKEAYDITLLACFAYLRKIKGGLWYYLAVCASLISYVERLGKHVTAAKNTHATIEELLGASFFFAFHVV